MLLTLFDTYFFFSSIILLGIVDVTGSNPNSATAFVDYTLPSSDIIEFDINERSKAVPIRIASENPADYEGQEEFTLMLEPVSSDEQSKIGFPNKAGVFITDRCTYSRNTILYETSFLMLN